jgi:hypothetical protein
MFATVFFNGSGGDVPRGFNIPTGSDLPEKLKKFSNTLADHLKSKREHNDEATIQPITAETLCYWAAEYHLTTLGQADIRAMINFLRRSRKPIGSASNGYFWAVNPQELESTIDHLSDRLNGIQSAYNGLKNAEFPDLKLF